MAIRLGTRSSALARWQADWVAAQLRALGVAVEVVFVTTSGDQKQAPLAAIGGAGLFTKEIQQALLAGQIDLAVHSLKDLPTEQPAGLCLAAVPPRESPWDVLLTRGGGGLADLPQGAVVGTGSLRRRAQMLHVREDLAMAEIRGNVDTRLRKLDEGQFDAIVLAEAGLKRLGLTSHAQHLLSAEVLPAVGQGALGLEVRANDDATIEAISPLNDAASHAAVLAERAMLAALRAGCLAPVGAWGRLVERQLLLRGRVLSVDGRQMVQCERSSDPADAQSLGHMVADELLAAGAADLLTPSRS